MPNRTAFRRIRLAFGFALALVACAPIVTRADTVASLLGNFTINQFCGIRLADDAVTVRYTVVFGQLPALRELHDADANGDGVTSQEERDAYVARLAPRFAEGLKLVVDGTSVPLKVTGGTSSLPTEQGGFSLRLDVDLVGAVPQSAASDRHTLRFANENYPGRFGWQEIVVEPSAPTAVFDSNAYSTSLTADLTEAVTELPATGPLSERAVHLNFTDRVPPPGAVLQQPRPGSAAAATQAPPRTMPTVDGAWLQRETRRIVNLISASEVAPHVLLLALFAAMVLGALHAFSPGHGKAVVGAYLIGSRATWRHAVFLGVTVTITHTIGVFALGFATLFASRYILPERLFPILSLLSGLLVFGMGVALFSRRWRPARAFLQRKLASLSVRQGPEAPMAFRPLQRRSLARSGRSFALVFAGGSHHAHHDHESAHFHHHHRADHSHAGATMHSHGGRMHSHLPPGASGDAVSWRSLIALGVSGGLVPCPSALVLLLAAIALNKTAYALTLVVAFSVGLAITLIGVGLAFLYARRHVWRAVKDASWPHLLPVLSALAITVVGAMLCYGAVISVPGAPFSFLTMGHEGD